MIKLHKPTMLSGKYLERVLESRHLTTGPQVELLRIQLAEYFDVLPWRIALGSSATACFQAYMEVLNRDVKCPIVVEWRGLATWPLMKKIADRLAPYPMNQLHHTIVVDTDIGGTGQGRFLPPEEEWFHDACHSWTRRKSTDWTLLSFYPTKLCGGAEGGALIGPNIDRVAEVQRVLNCGTIGMGQRPDFTKIHSLGRKANMTDVAAALNREALERLDERKERVNATHRTLVRMFQHLGGKVDRLLLHEVQAYLFQVRVEDVAQALRIAEKWKISAQVNFPPAKLITLPCYPELSDEEMHSVAHLAATLSKEEV
jgi:dTDP-4-amino-4,6-dideoxygalactose transaminase